MAIKLRHTIKLMMLGRSIANVLSISRILSVPLLLYLAYLRNPDVFLIVLGVSLLTDVMDGFIVRTFSEPSEIGARLDSWADFSLCAAFPYCVWVLWPEIVLSKILFVVIALVSYFFPILIGLIKFGKLPSYHTWAGKAAAIFMTVAVFLMVKMNLSLPFRAAALYQSLVALESTLITLSLSAPQSNVKSFFHVIRSLRRSSAGEHLIGR
jgi:CDP-diacylglycerol---glycerol-3-phosphate 3-phosphatidyltransferase